MEVLKSRNVSWEKQALINDIKQGQELAKQLQNLLVQVSTASSESCHFLVEKIISSYEKTLKKFDSSTFSSSCMDHGSTHQDYKNKTGRGRGASKKRKVQPKWTEHVQVQSETWQEGSLDDGYCWRKYGQKDILGAIHPRGYYRCSDRDTQGCLAMKQVQRSNQDPTIFHITYIGQHICTKSKHLMNVNTQLQLPDTEIIKPISSPEQVNLQKRRKIDQWYDQFWVEFRVNNDDCTPEDQLFPSFPSTSANKPDDYVFSSAAESDFNASSHASEYNLSYLNKPCWDTDLANARSYIPNSPEDILDFPLESAGLAMDFGSEYLCNFLDFE